MAIGCDRYGASTHVPLHAQRLLRFASDLDGNLRTSRAQVPIKTAMEERQTRERERYHRLVAEMGSCRKAVWWHVLLRPHGRPLAAILTSGRCPCSSHAVQLRAALAHTEAASPGESGRLCRSPSAQ